jgi:hypothetical protein
MMGIFFVVGNDDEKRGEQKNKRKRRPKKRNTFPFVKQAKDKKRGAKILCYLQGL